MTTYIHYQPLNIIPAEGWQAVYAYRKKTEKVFCNKEGLKYLKEVDVFAHAVPLVCFAVTHTTEASRNGPTSERNEVLGYIASGDIIIKPVAETSNFLGYLAPGDSLSNWEDAAQSYVEALEDAEADTEQETPETCTWRHGADSGGDDYYYWETDCGISYHFGDGTPSENGMKFCPYCGRPIEEVSDDQEN